MSDRRTRQPAGTPVGGQFAREQRGRAHLSLVTDIVETATNEPETTAKAQIIMSGSTRVTNDGQYTTIRGSKYTGWRDVTEIAKDLRTDIKNAVAEGALPGEATYSVTVDKYSGGQAIHIEVRGLDYDQIYGPQRPDGTRSHRYTEAAAQIVRTLEGLGAAYDKSTSDPLTSYHHGNHFTFAQIATPASVAYDRADKLNKALRRTERDVRQRLAPLADRTGIAIQQLLDPAVAADPRCAALTEAERSVLHDAYAALASAREKASLAQQHYRMLRESEKVLADPD